MQEEFALARFQEAAARINPHIRRTEVIELEKGLLAKAEQRQRTGSFKVRGALNKILQLSEQELASGVVCASAGNHGLGVAFACSLIGARCTVVVPADAAKVKIAAIERLGAEVIRVEGGYGFAEENGRDLARSTGAVWVSPYNDRHVILGQGTIALELANQIQDWFEQGFDLYLPASGGGLLCGVGLALKQLGNGCNVIGVQTAAAPYLHAHQTMGNMDQVRESDTLADGLAGPVEADSITLELLGAAADEIQLVSEREILDAVRWLAGIGFKVEPSAAVAAAAARKRKEHGRVVVVLSGGNIDDELFNQIVNGA